MQTVRFEKAGGELSVSVDRSNYQHCVVEALGMEMPCPRCGIVVQSGERHECEANSERSASASNGEVSNS